MCVSVCSNVCVCVLQYYIHSGRQMVFSVNVTRPKKPGKFSGELLLYSSLGKVSVYRKCVI